MSVAFRRVDEEITDPGSRDMLLLRCDIREDDARRYFCSYPLQRSLLEILLSQFREAEKPEYGLRNP